MLLAAILGMYVLLPWLNANIAPSVQAMEVWQSRQSQENLPTSSAPNDSSNQPPTDQQKTPDQTTAPPTSTSPCPENSQPGMAARPDCKPPESAGTKTKKRHRSHKTVAPAPKPGETEPPKKVVPNGGADDPALNLSLGPGPQATQQRETTKQLLAATDANLNKVSQRTLSANQQDTVKQIKSYTDQAKKALSDGDVQRAYNLAIKANLLSADMVRH